METAIQAGSAPERAALPRTIWYMGAKARVIPGFLDRALDDLVPRGGAVLDLFSGTGLVAAWCARRWRVIANDVQEYARAIARGFIERPPRGGKSFLKTIDIERDLRPAFEENRSALEAIYGDAMEEEAERLEGIAAGRNGDRTEALRRYRAFLRLPGGIHGEERVGRMASLYRRAGKLIEERSLSRYRTDPGRFPACLVTAYYANVYYGLRQAIELDSLRRAIGHVEGERKRIHYLSALLHAASVTTSGTSHFAQPRGLGKDPEVAAMARRRSLDVLAVFREYSEEIAGWVAAHDLHPRNRCLRSDWRGLLAEGPRGPVWSEEARADVVYMDPPYTADNYSRFYHVLETLASYEYPPLERRAGRITAGRYPEIGLRFQSDFCKRARVEEEFREAIAATARSGAEVIISYGSPNGLLLKVYRDRGERDPIEAMRRLCAESYRRVEVERRSILHSGQGDKNTPTVEVLVIGRRPK